MMRGDSQADHDDCHGRGRNKSPQTEPVSRPLERSCLLTNAPHHVPGKKRRQLRLGNATERIPQFLVIFTIHSLQSIELSAEMEVALEWQPYSEAGSFKEAFELPNTSWMPHFAQCLCFDLADALAGDLKLPAYFFQGSAVAIDQPESLLEDLPFTIGQGFQHVLNFFFRQHNRSHVDRDANRAGLVGNRAGDGLANPPRRVGGKLVPAPILEFLDRLHQPHISFLDQVKKG